MYIRLTTKWCTLIMAVSVMFFSCKTSKRDFVEPDKDISGRWKIIKASQNGTDITPLIDLDKFTIQFNTDKTYTITGKLPFIVPVNGTWSLQDPQRPFAISFAPGGGNLPVESQLAFPIVDGEYQMGIIFRNACDGKFENTYRYTLKQVKE